MRVYLAGPLFSLAERRFMADLRDLAEALPGLKALWPGDFFAAEDLAAMGATAKKHIFGGCLAGVDACDLVVAVLDGAQVDDGTSFEAGYAYARGIPVWGLRTDFRVAGDSVHSLVNCMIECACQRTFREVEALLSALSDVCAGGGLQADGEGTASVTPCLSFVQRADE